MAAQFANTLLSLIVMHGISMTVWRHLLNQTSPFSARSGTSSLPRFTFQLSNTVPPSDSGATTLAPTMMASSSQVVSQFHQQNQQSSPSAAYIQPIIQLQPIPIQLPQIPGYSQFSGLLQHQQQSQQQPLIILPVTRSDNVPSKQYHQQPMYIQQIPAPVVQVSPAMVTQASTLNPIRVAAPKEAVRAYSSSTKVTAPSTRKNWNQDSSIKSNSTTTDINSRFGKDQDSRVTSKVQDPGNTTESVKLLGDGKLEGSNRISDNLFMVKDDVRWNGFRTACYYLLESNDGSVLTPDRIDPTICSDIIVGHAYIGPTDLIWFKKPQDNVRRLREVAKLKAKNPALKVFLSVRMASTSNASGNETNILASEEYKHRFTRSLVDIVGLYHLDGIDFFWPKEFKDDPEDGGGADELDSRKDLIKLIELIRRECLRKGRLETLIMATVTANPKIALKAYNITELAKSVDFLNLLTFDYHFYHQDRPYTGHHSLLYPRVTTHSGIDITSTDEVYNFWLGQGISQRKILLGIPTFARTFNLVFPFAQGFNSPANGHGLGGGQINFTRVCEFLRDGGESQYDEKSQVPFAHRNYDWISYENEKSISVKARYAAQRRIGGIMTYALNYDDWSGSCRDDSKSFPLQRVVSSTLKLAALSSVKSK